MRLTPRAARTGRLVDASPPGKAVHREFSGALVIALLGMFVVGLGLLTGMAQAAADASSDLAGTPTTT